MLIETERLRGQYVLRKTRARSPVDHVVIIPYDVVWSSGWHMRCIDSL